MTRTDPRWRYATRLAGASPAPDVILVEFIGVLARKTSPAWWCGERRLDGRPVTFPTPDIPQPIPVNNLTYWPVNRVTIHELILRYCVTWLIVVEAIYCGIIPDWLFDRPRAPIVFSQWKEWPLLLLLYLILLRQFSEPFCYSPVKPDPDLITIQYLPHYYSIIVYSILTWWRGDYYSKPWKDPQLVTIIPGEEGQTDLLVVLPRLLLTLVAWFGVLPYSGEGLPVDRPVLMP